MDAGESRRKKLFQSKKFPTSSVGDLNVLEIFHLTLPETEIFCNIPEKDFCRQLTRVACHFCQVSLRVKFLTLFLISMFMQVGVSAEATDLQFSFFPSFPGELEKVGFHSSLYFSCPGIYRQVNFYLWRYALFLVPPPVDSREFTEGRKTGTTATSRHPFCDLSLSLANWFSDITRELFDFIHHD